ncbi:hypothetical protein RvY_11412-1 [Ramazzottius varieornatus]|uniref:Uncharacterized protein n=1 Tax=Ramazzottius varieornatus TaxID=947166 RepID=A0A1D1VIG0_RAMVA|nr:hypothetical protein RvY_11412-1 [Ramazzottius varieornatus]
MICGIVPGSGQVHECLLTYLDYSVDGRARSYRHPLCYNSRVRGTGRVWFANTFLCYCHFCLALRIKHRLLPV